MTPVATALDANIISALLRSEANAAQIAQRLAELMQDGPLVISPVVYAELLASPGMTLDYLRDFLRDTQVTLLAPPELPVWEEAGLAYGAYAERRRRSGGGQPRRILSDFLIGAHALSRSDRLFTADPQHYRLGFAGLDVLEL